MTDDNFISDYLKSNDFTFNTVSGDMIVRDADMGKLFFHTVSGDMKIGKVKNIKRCDVDSTSGDVEIALEKYPVEDVYFNIDTVSGYIGIILPFEFKENINLKAKTKSGIIRSKELIKERKNEIFVNNGDGLINFTLSTISGDININFTY